MTPADARQLACAALLAATLVCGSVHPAHADARDWQDTPGWLEPAPSTHASTVHLDVRALPPEEGRDGVVTLRLRITPRPGMRVYAQDVTGYVPLSLALDVPDGVTVARPAYPAPVEYVFPPTGERSRVHRDAFTVTQRVRLARGAADLDDVTGTLRYQACDDRLCYKPASVSIRWTEE